MSPDFVQTHKAGSDNEGDESKDEEEEEEEEDTWGYTSDEKSKSPGKYSLVLHLKWDELMYFEQ